jgi:AbrB family looped-hinge helix DNA binding protein
MKVNRMSAPQGKHIFGAVRVSEKGQIVIPKKARNVFDIKPGDMLLVLGDETQGLAIVKQEVLLKRENDACADNTLFRRS